MSTGPAPLAAPAALRAPLSGAIAAGHEALLVADDADPFALTGCWAGSRALVGSLPLHRADGDADPFTTLADAGAAPPDAPAGFVGGGWFGYLGYALTDGPARRPRRLPASVLGFYDHLLRLDEDGQWWFEALWTPERDATLRDRHAQLAARLAARPPRRPASVTTTPWTSTPSPAGHARAVRAARARIVAGDLYQANVALRLQARLNGTPADLFSTVAARLAPDRAAFLAGEWGAVASLSPELFLTRRGRTVQTRPIKGTRPRADDPAAAAPARDELAASAKDRAENVMIVDLMRNDLGRVAQTGSVQVSQLAATEAHPGVWHLVSEVHAQLRPDADDADLLRAAFPPGSVTGAPKIAAIAVIDELESHAREVFTGSIGFHSPVAGLELSVVIRSFEIHGDDVWIDVGGGIVADSDSEEEAAEALVKAAPLIAACGGELTDIGDAAPLPVPAQRRLSPRPAPRPDGAGGLLETILVRDGEPVLLEAHLQRLAESMGVLYATAPPADLAPRARAAAAVPGTGRLRLLADPGGEVDIQTGPPAPAPQDETLVAVTVPGGVGAHKWQDRRWLDALSAAVAPAMALLVDLDGTVLEAASAAVLVGDGDGGLIAPPLDGRILPSVTRAEYLRRARAAGRSVTIGLVTLHDLGRAPEILLASALRGVRPVSYRAPAASAVASATSIRTP